MMDIICHTCLMSLRDTLYIPFIPFALEGLEVILTTYQFFMHFTLPIWQLGALAVFNFLN